MTHSELIADLASRGCYTPHELLVAELFLRHIADYLSIAAIQNGLIPRDCRCRETLLECADALHVEKTKLYAVEKAKVSA